MNNYRRLVYPMPGEAGSPSRQALTLADAKLLARRLLPELATIECPPAVVGTALAIVVGAVAARITVAAREDFYEKFLSAARACEEAMDRRECETRKH